MPHTGRLAPRPNCAFSSLSTQLVARLNVERHAKQIVGVLPCFDRLVS